MKINIQDVNFNADQKLIEFTKERLNKVEHYFDRVIDVDVYLKLENTSDKENKIAELRVHVPKENIVVTKQCKTFEEAVDSACKVVERSLLKLKDKRARKHA
jgi:putative sigma-54 modulation protein